MATSPERPHTPVDPSRRRRASSRLSSLLGGSLALATLYAGFWWAGDAIAGEDEPARVRPGKKLAPNHIGIDELKPGMKGYALTVFSGEVPDKFEVEIIDI